MSRIQARVRMAAAVAVASIGGITGLVSSAQSQAPAVKRVAILQSASPTSGSYEAGQAGANGMAVEMLTDAQWRSKSRQDFAAYDALVIPERSCNASATISASAAQLAPAITGNRLLIGTDPSDHASQGGEALVRNGIAFAAAQDGRTGLYIAFECDNRDATVRQILDDLHGTSGEFSTRTAGCYDRSHRVVDHPAFVSTTDASLSNWGCSVHNAFEQFPDDRYLALGIAEGLGEFTAADGTIGLPYILASGQGISYKGRDIVAIGDSVSAGEGIGYGYEWRNDGERWEDKNGSGDFWDLTFNTEQCHQREEAHPRVLAQITGARLVDHLSCTGATFDEGIVGVQPKRDLDKPQVGGFNPGPPFNPRYLNAAPDIVTVSLGANDIGFADVVATCFYGSVQVLTLSTCGGNVDRAIERLEGDYVKDRFRVLHEQLRNVGISQGKRPLVLHTQYANPFPASDQDNDCFDLDGDSNPLPFSDGSGFSRDRVIDMRYGLTLLNSRIARAANAFEGALSIPASPEFADHPFCSDDPWIFGMDTAVDPRLGGLQSSAPFHPTVAGQQAIARQTKSIVDRAISMRRGGADVVVRYASGEAISFADVDVPGTTVIVERPDSQMPSHPAFGMRKGYFIETSAVYNGPLRITLPGEPGDKLWHYVDGRWEEVPSTFANGVLSGQVTSLSPFAVGPSTEPVTARVADASGGPAPAAVAFDASPSGGPIAEITWDFGDGTVGRGAHPSHTYPYSGAYTATVTVRGSGGQTDSATVTVTVTNPAPDLVADVPSSVEIGQTLMLDSSRSTDPNGTVERAYWLVDDKPVASTARTTVTFDSPGVREVRAVVLDNELKQATRTFTVEVRGIPGSGSGGGGGTPGGGSGGGGGTPGTTPRPTTRAKADIRIERVVLASDGGRVVFRLTCKRTAGACRGRVQAAVGSHRMTVRYRARAKRGTTLVLRLPSAQRRRSGSGRRIGVRLKVTTDAGATATRAVKVQRLRG